MAKKVTGVVKLQIPAGAANPAPPVGPALGSAGVNIMQFCKEFNAKTAKDSGLVIPVIITVYQDRSFSLKFKSPPASVLLKKEAGLAKGSGVPNKNKVGKVTREQLKKIVEMKKADLNTTDVEQAMKMIEGTARTTHFHTLAEDINHGIAVYLVAVFVHRNTAVRIAVKGKAYVQVLFLHQLL